MRAVFAHHESERAAFAHFDRKRNGEIMVRVIGRVIVGRGVGWGGVGVRSTPDIVFVKHVF